jgi:hypothetical protein
MLLKTEDEAGTVHGFEENLQMQLWLKTQWGSGHNRSDGDGRQWQLLSLHTGYCHQRWCIDHEWLKVNFRSTLASFLISESGSETLLHRSESSLVSESIMEKRWPWSQGTWGSAKTSPGFSCVVLGKRCIRTSSARVELWLLHLCPGDEDWLCGVAQRETTWRVSRSSSCSIRERMPGFCGL